MFIRAIAAGEAVLSVSTKARRGADVAVLRWAIERTTHRVDVSLLDAELITGYISFVVGLGRSIRRPTGYLLCAGAHSEIEGQYSTRGCEPHGASAD